MRAFQRIEQNFRKEDPQHSKMKNAFYDLRDEISGLVKTCARDVQVVVYFNGVLDDPITVTVGPGKNRLRITIKRNGTITYGWTKETLGKIFRDAWEDAKSISKKILVLIAKTAFGILKITSELHLGIAFI